MQFFESFSLMLSSGIEVMDILVSQEAEIKSQRYKNLLEDIRIEIENGNPLWFAFQKVKLLPTHLLAIIQLGEESGNLVENLKVAEDYIKREDDFRSKVKSASLYPAIVLVLLIIIGFGIGLFVLPNLSKTYTNLNIDLPWITRFMIDLGDFLKAYGYIIIPAIISVSIFTGYILFVNPKTKSTGQWIMFRTPVVKRIVQEMELLRFGYLFGTLLESGVPILDALELIQIATPYKVYRKFYKNLYQYIEAGFSFEESIEKILHAKKLLPLYVRQLIVSAEKTASLPESLVTVGKAYMRKADATTNSIATLLEPVLLIIVWVGVSLIAFAVVLPMYSLTGSITSVGTDAQSGGATQSRSIAVTINQTETGEIPIKDKINGTTIAVAESGTTYTCVLERPDWCKIVLEKGGYGWVQQIYYTKNE